MINLTKLGLVAKTFILTQTLTNIEIGIAILILHYLFLVELELAIFTMFLLSYPLMIWQGKKIMNLLAKKKNNDKNLH